MPKVHCCIAHSPNSESPIPWGGEGGVGRDWRDLISLPAVVRTMFHVHYMSCVVYYVLYFVNFPFYDTRESTVPVKSPRARSNYTAEIRYTNSDASSNRSPLRTPTTFVPLGKKRTSYTFFDESVLP